MKPLILEGPDGTGFYIARSPNEAFNVPAFWCKRCSLSVTFGMGTVPPLRVHHCGGEVAEYAGELDKLQQFAWREIAMPGSAAVMEHWGDKTVGNINYHRGDISTRPREAAGEEFKWEGTPPPRGFL